jgi:HAD superfamily hydrolase (TIGR01490 family)
MLGPVEAAFFDLDKTVIARASMVAFGRPLYHEGLISRTTVVKALYGQLVYMHLGASEQKLARIRESVLTLTRGWERDRIHAIVRETLEEVIEPISYAEALEEIELHQAAGRLVYIVSASPEEIVEPMAEYLGVDGAIASQPRVDEDGRYTGEMAFYAYGHYKAEAIEKLAAAKGIDLSASWAYSDSYTDLPMMEVVGHPVAINPDRVLSRLARERGWETRQWVRTVRLRARRAPPGGAPGVAAAAALVGLAGVGVWWQMARRTRHTPRVLAPWVSAGLARYVASSLASSRSAPSRLAASRLVPSRLPFVDLRARSSAADGGPDARSVSRSNGSVSRPASAWPRLHRHQ